VRAVHERLPDDCERVVIWWLIFVYVLAGITVGRMAWEFDVFTVDPILGERPQDVLARSLARRVEVFVCWVAGVVWPVVPLWALWTHVRNPR